MQKAPLIADVMIGGEDDHHASGVLPTNPDGRQTEAGGGIPPHRFGQKIFFRDLGDFPAQVGNLGAGGDDVNFFRGTKGRIRSTVSQIMDRSERIGRTCLGRFSRLQGQKRVPPPPAMMTA